MRGIAILLIGLSLAGCSHKYRADAYDAPASALSKEGGAYIMAAADGRYDTRTYAGSGQSLAQATYAAVLLKMDRVERAPAIGTRDAAFDAARSKGLAYVFEPIILHWEDRATEWSGRPDRITVKITVWDAATGKSLTSGIERASTKWATFGGDHPQDLLPKMLERFVTRAFGG